MTENNPSSRPASYGSSATGGRAPYSAPAAGPRPVSTGTATPGPAKPAVPEPSKGPSSPLLPPPSSAGTHEPGGIDSPAAIDLLRRIHDQMERANRRSRQHDFSVLRLFGALLQMFAIAMGLWGLIALTGDNYDAASARFILACLLQLASVTAFAHDYLR